jgi:hypothetical protein
VKRLTYIYISKGGTADIVNGGTNGQDTGCTRNAEMDKILYDIDNSRTTCQ